METIILLFLFILIPLVNYLLERMRRRSQAAPDERRRPPDPGVRRQAPPATAPITRRERAQQTPSVPVERPESRRRRRALFSNKRDVRRAIIAMTILGPCRAYDPPDEFQR